MTREQLDEINRNPEYRAFIAAIRSSPDLDLPKTQLSDWLEERGHKAHADMIRADVLNDQEYRLRCEARQGYSGDVDLHYLLHKPNRSFAARLLTVWNSGVTAWTNHPYTEVVLNDPLPIRMGYIKLAVEGADPHFTSSVPEPIFVRLPVEGRHIEKKGKVIRAEYKDRETAIVALNIAATRWLNDGAPKEGAA